MKKSAHGFTLIELMVVIAIVATLYVILINFINPIELTRRARDTDRLSDLSYIRNLLSIKASENSTISYCYNLSSPCQQSTYPLGKNTRDSSGSGWIKVDFSPLTEVSIPTLPVDPINNSDLNYIYYSDGTYWEINTTLESTKFSDLMIKDGGNNDSKYEVGTKLILLH